MKFISIRDLRNKSAQIQQELPKEKEMILTSNGKPFAILSMVSGETLEETLMALRRTRAIAAVTEMQIQSVKAGTDRMTMEEINKEIQDEREHRQLK